MKYKPVIPPNYPGENPSGFFSTFNVMDIFSWKRGLIKGWIEDKYIEPVYRVPEKRGLKSYFAGYQLYSLALFKSLLEVGISRNYASIWVKAFENLWREQWNEDPSKDPSFVVFELSKGTLSRLTILFGAEEMFVKAPEEATFDNLFIVNFRKIISAVDKATT